MSAVVCTVLFSGCDDPQRPKGCNPDWEIRADHEQLAPLLDSVQGATAIVFHDQLDPPDDRFPNAVFVKSLTPERNVYFDRWDYIAYWLDEWHRTIDQVFITDGTDVKMYRTPWPEMVPNILYTCSEADKTVSLPWLVNNHPSIRPFVGLFPNLPLVHAGLCGGDTNTVRAFLARLGPYLDEGVEAGDMTDMAAFNRCVWSEFSPRLVYGPKVHTVFTGYEPPNGFSWWAHR